MGEGTRDLVLDSAKFSGVCPEGRNFVFNVGGIREVPDLV